MTKGSHRICKNIFIFSKRTSKGKKIKKSLQGNAPRQTKIDRQSSTEKNNEGITAVWQKWRFSAPQTHLCFNQTLVLRINSCDKNRHLRQAPNRKADSRLLLLNFYLKPCRPLKKMSWTH